MAEWSRAHADKYANQIEDLEKRRLISAKKFRKEVSGMIKQFVADDNELLQKILNYENKLEEWGITSLASKDEVDSSSLSEPRDYVVDQIEEDVFEDLREQIEEADEQEEEDDEEGD